MLGHIFIKGVRLSRYILIGALISLMGVALVILNGNFILKLNPLGDFLTFGAAFSWAVYSILIRQISGKYNVLFITRKLFFYGMISLSPYFFFQPFGAPLQTVLIPEVAANLLFLGLIASSLCYVMWSTAIRNLGPITTNNYIYLLPLITMITAAIVLDEKITIYILLGALLIISGVWFAENGSKLTGKERVK
jgi:drug/metabolite transporter (DMT)-like permease